MPARPSLARTCLNAAGRTAGGAALLTALFGHGGYRYEVRRRLFADGDAAQISLAAALASLDLTVLLVTLRAAPFAVAPFVVWTLVV